MTSPQQGTMRRALRGLIFTESCRCGKAACLFMWVNVFYFGWMKPDDSIAPAKMPQREGKLVREPLSPEMIALFRILLKASPKGHDASICPLCKENRLSRD
jgi:hypothetical protein